MYSIGGCRFQILVPGRTRAQNFRHATRVDGHPRVHRANVLHVAQATCALALCAYPSCLPVSRHAMWSGLFGGAPKTSANAGAPPLGNASSFLALAFSSTLASCYIRHRSPRPKFIWLGLKHMRTQGSRQDDIGTSTW